MTPNIVKGSNSLPADRYDHPNHPRNKPEYQPDLLKQGKTEADQSNMSGNMDGDNAAKTMDAGSNKATNVADMTEGLHEDASQKLGAGDKTTGHGTSMFSKDGAIGSQFTAQGNIGQIGEKVGGPFSSEGVIGKNFTEHGAIGGSVQKMAEKNERH